MTAITKCPDCGREVSYSAKACPGCGRTIVRGMPIVITLVLMAALLYAAWRWVMS